MEKLVTEGVKGVKLLQRKTSSGTTTLDWIPIVEINLILLTNSYTLGIHLNAQGLCLLLSKIRGLDFITVSCNMLIVRNNFR